MFRVMLADQWNAHCPGLGVSSNFAKTQIELHLRRLTGVSVGGFVLSSFSPSEPLLR